MLTLTLIPQILAMLQAGLTIAPEVATAAQTEYQLFTTGAPPTPAQQAAIDSALEAANTALAAMP